METDAIEAEPESNESEKKEADTVRTDSEKAEKNNKELQEKEESEQEEEPVKGKGLATELEFFCTCKYSEFLQFESLLL